MPSVPGKDGYTGAWDKTVSFVTENVTVTAVYTAIPDSPQTGDNSLLLLWVALMCISGAALVASVVYRKKMSV